MTELEQSAWNYDIVVPIFFLGAFTCCGIYLCILFVQEYMVLKTLKKKNNNKMIQKYRKKSVVIEAIQFVGTYYSANEILEFVGLKGEIVNSKEPDHLFDFIIHTLDGDKIVEVGDYVIKGVDGEFYPCKSDIFEKTYEKVY